MGIHYGFSIVHAFAYAVLAEKCSKVTALRGGLFELLLIPFSMNIFYRKWD